MRLPTLSVIIVSQAIIWCIAGTMVHGPTILLYPLSWAVIGAAFFFHNKRNPIALPTPTITKDSSWANSKTDGAKTQRDDQKRSEKVSASK